MHSPNAPRIRAGIHNYAVWAATATLRLCRRFGYALQMPLRAARLAALPIFANLTRCERMELSRHLRGGHAQAQTMLIDESQSLHVPLFILQQGRAVIRKLGADCRQHDVSELWAPAIFGEMDVMARRPPLCSVYTLSDVRYLTLSSCSIAALCQSRSTGILKVLTNLSMVLRSRSEVTDTRRLGGQHISGLQRVLYNGWGSAPCP